MKASANTNAKNGPPHSDRIGNLVQRFVVALGTRELRLRYYLSFCFFMHGFHEKSNLCQLFKLIWLAANFFGILSYLFQIKMD